MYFPPKLHPAWVYSGLSRHEPPMFSEARTGFEPAYDGFASVWKGVRGGAGACEPVRFPDDSRGWPFGEVRASTRRTGTTPSTTPRRRGLHTGVTEPNQLLKVCRRASALVHRSSPRRARADHVDDRFCDVIARVSSATARRSWNATRVPRFGAAPHPSMAASLDPPVSTPESIGHRCMLHCSVLWASHVHVPDMHVHGSANSSHATHAAGP